MLWLTGSSEGPWALGEKPYKEGRKEMLPDTKIRYFWGQKTQQ